MVRLVVLVLALLAGSAHAQLGIDDIKDEVGRLDVRWHASYTRAVANRDFFAEVHDSIHHRAYNEMVAAKDKYVAIRKELNKAISSGDNSTGTRKVGELEDAGKELGERVEVYTNSSADAVEKIQIGLGVAAFVICGLVYWLFKRRKKK